MRALSQLGERMIVPSPLTSYTIAAPIRSVLPQPSQAYCAVVTSKEKISLREPAAALPSSLSSSSITLTSSGSQAFGLHARRVMSQVDQSSCHRLHKRRRAAEEVEGRSPEYRALRAGVSGMISMTSPRRQAILLLWGLPL